MRYSHKKLIYLPAGVDQKPWILERCATGMLNATYPLPAKHLNKLKNKLFICIDSGGFQSFIADKQGKTIIYGPMMKTIKNNQSVFALGTISNCLEYDRIGATMAIMIDRVTFCHDNDAIYYQKLSESLKARNSILKAASYLCPNTKLVPVLQFRNSLEVKDCFNWISTPLVSSYAIPIRNFRNRPVHALGNSYILSFLSSQNVQHVHFLGSSAPTVIFVLAKALALGMFDRLSFDSTTWNRGAFSPRHYLCPKTLNEMPLEDQLNPKDILSKVMNLKNDLLKAIVADFNPGEEALAKNCLGLLNIRSIESFAKMALNFAMEDGLRHCIYSEDFPKYGKNKEKIIKAFDLLEESSEYGHEYVERKYETNILDLSY